MTNRRQFLQLIPLGTATAALTAFAAPLAAMPVLDASQPLFKFVYDSRHRASTQLASGMAVALGADHLHAMQGDITPFWYGELQQLWQQQALAVAGLTEAGPLFCLQQLAPQYGLRVVWQQELRNAEGATLVSWIIAPARGAARGTQQAQEGRNA